jgi:allophanate hydrolase subunit 2
MGISKGGVMDRQTVQSSNITSVGYDAENCLLEVEFKSGVIYRYVSVPSDVYTALMRASSIGAFFSASIRDRYETLRIN